MARRPRYLKDWEKHLVPEAGRFPRQTLLELGAGEGRSAVWFLDNVLPLADSRYIGIDCWGTSRRSARAEDRCRRALAPYRGKAALCKGPIEMYLPMLEGPYHVVYIDAAKDTESVVHYSELVWPMVAPGGLVIWADYRNTQNQTVMNAVDSLPAEWEYDTVWCHDQLCARKI